MELFIVLLQTHGQLMQIPLSYRGYWSNLQISYLKPLRI